MSKTKDTHVIRCTCSNEGQDEIHGKGMRVHNATLKGSGTTIWRCTVCSKERGS